MKNYPRVHIKKKRTNKKVCSKKYFVSSYTEQRATNENAWSLSSLKLSKKSIIFFNISKYQYWSFGCR